MFILSELLQGADYQSKSDIAKISIGGITTDSRKVKEGDLFICVKGAADDGHKHVLEARMLGAAAVVSEIDTECGLPQIKVTNSRETYSIICQNFFKNPKNDLKIVTIVGTNGKTTTSYILEHLLRKAGYKTGVIGTIGYKINDEMTEADLTTPDSYLLNRLLRKMVSAGVEIVIIEASAHAIAQGRMYGLKSDITIFTNITQDHLDYFGTFEAYSNTKLSFFLSGYTKSAIVNSDDEYGRKILNTAKIPMVSYGIDEPSDVFAIDIQCKKDGTSFIINLFDELYQIKSPLYGKHNVYNVLAAVTLAKMLKVSTPLIAESLRQMQPVSGRFNIFSYKNAKIIVDFAHTPDGLANLLKAARPLCKNKLYLVFGCGGDRDRGKRPKMGAIAEALADEVYVTEDNSRSEDTESIIGEITGGMKDPDNVHTVADRREAINLVLSLLGGGDVAVISGKGAEKYIEKKGRRVKFCDIDYVGALCDGDGR